jgi:hypothetical protein
MAVMVAMMVANAGMASAVAIANGRGVNWCGFCS